MESSEFTSNSEVSEQIELLKVSGATSNSYKRRVDGKLFFVKELKEAFRNDKRYREAYYKEYEVGRKISSPYVARYVAIEDDGAGLRLVMNYVNGVTLAQKLASEPNYFRNKGNLRKFMHQLALALHDVHKHNIVHMDIKPENVMLTKASNNVVLVDLGFCLSNENDFTTGCSSEFAAPEALGGHIDEIDARTDIYSVGCLLNYIEKAADRKLPRNFSDIMKKCMRRTKSERYANVMELNAAINEKARWGWIAAAAAVAIILAGS